MVFYDRQFRNGKYYTFILNKEGFKMIDYGMYKDRKINNAKNGYGVKPLSHAVLGSAK